MMRLSRFGSSIRSHILLNAIAVAVILLVAVSILGYVAKWEWIGLASYAAPENTAHYKTLWDWLQLLFVPAVIALFGVWFNDRQQESEQRAVDSRTQDEALENYLASMSELLLREDGRFITEPGGRHQIVARARTLATLARLDASRKSALLRFLYEAGLVSAPDRSESDDGGTNANVSGPIVKLEGADLTGIDMTGVSLKGIDLSGAILDDAILQGADLGGAELQGARMRRADFSVGPWGHFGLKNTSLIGANLYGADLTDANLHEAGLHNTDLRSAKLIRADLRQALLTTPERPEVHARVGTADLTGANLLGAEVDYRHLVTCWSLDGTRLPDGAIAEGPHRDDARKPIELTVRDLLGESLQLVGYSINTWYVLPKANSRVVRVFSITAFRLDATGTGASTDRTLEQFIQLDETLSPGESKTEAVAVGSIETGDGGRMEVGATIRLAVDEKGHVAPPSVIDVRCSVSGGDPHSGI